MSWFPFGAGSAGAWLRLFCFPYAGSGASVYLKWPGAFPQRIAICPVQSPGRENRWGEPPIDDIERLLDRLADAVLPHLDRPYALFGYSLGARLAFALTHRLRQRGAPGPVRLIVAANRDPASPPLRAGLHRLPEPEFLAYLRELGGTPDKVLEDRLLVELLMPLLRADFALAEAAVPLDPVSCPITACSGREDSAAPPELVSGWSRFTSADFVMHTFRGGHFFLREQTAALIDVVIRDLQRDLDRLPGPALGE